MTYHLGAGGGGGRGSISTLEKFRFEMVLLPNSAFMRSDKFDIIRLLLRKIDIVLHEKSQFEMIL